MKHPMLPSRRDKMLLVCSVVFVLGGILMMFDPEQFWKGLGGTVLFGSFAVVFNYSLRAKSRFEQQITEPPKNIGVEGYRRIGFKRGRFYGLAMGTTVVGIAMWVGYAEESIAMKISCGVMIIGGIGFAFCLLVGIAGSDYLQFEQEGLRMGFRWGSVLLEWDNIETAIPMAMNDNPALYLTFKDMDSLFESIEATVDHRRARSRLQKRITWTQRLQGCDLFLMTSQFGIDLATLVQSIAKYIKHPETREELKHTERLTDGLKEMP